MGDFTALPVGALSAVLAGSLATGAGAAAGAGAAGAGAWYWAGAAWLTELPRLILTASSPSFISISATSEDSSNSMSFFTFLISIVRSLGIFRSY